MNFAPLLPLYLILHNIRDVLTGQCWQGPTYSETVVSPELRSSSILRVPEVLTLAQCVGACCDLPGCDLAWFFERRCYILSCQQKQNCQPKKRPGTDSRLAFLQHRRPQTLVLQSLVRGEPYASHWRPLPRHRGPENPLKDLALLEDIQDLDDNNNALQYDESYRTVEDDISEERTDSKMEQEKTQRLLDWPLEERDGFNFSETEGGKIKLSLMESTEDSQVTPSSSLAVTDGTRPPPSLAEPSWIPSAFSLPNVKDEEDQFNISFTGLDPTAMPQVISADLSKLSPVSSSLPSPPDMGSTTPSSSSLPEALIVSIGDVDDITLPENAVELTASVDSQTETENPYTYEWSFVSAPIGHPGVMEGKHKRTVKVSELSAGVYVVKVSVTGKQAYGESAVNFTVHPEVRLNMPPKSVALPKHQDVSPSVDTIIFINGSQSSDDSGIVSYLWEQVDGPLWNSDGPMNTPVLTLQNISPGDYTFRLMVVDSEGLSDSTTATVRVSSPKDKPPVAIAGTDQVIRLPLNHLTLWANQSTDDHAISSFLWSLHPSSPTKSATIQGVRSPALQLSDLQEGQYTFQLTVTDSSGQQDSDTVSVTVLADNRAPVAVAGPDRELILPVSSITLNGSDSTDDQAITSYQWEILSGPPGSEIKDASTAVALVSGLRAGSYRFKLTVQDEQGASDSAVLTVTVKEAESLPLIAHASGSHTLTLPNNSLVLRGSVSNCGSTNVSFLWVRDEQSPAAGDILFGSDHEASLYLANLVEGTYLFQLRVSDGQGRSSTAMATVEVRPDVREREEVEMELQVPLAQISHQQKESVVRQLAALLHVLDADITMKGLHGQSDISTVFRFSVRGSDGMIPGPKLARLLRYQLLKEKTDYLLFKVLRVDTVSEWHRATHFLLCTSLSPQSSHIYTQIDLFFHCHLLWQICAVCLLLCSGHGQCDPVTRSCSCDPLWMENPFRHFLDDESNCDWSVLYVTVCCVVVIIFLVSSSWAWCKRSRRTKVRKKTKYTILDNMDEQERMELRPKYNIKHRSTEHNSSLMMSESEIDSEQDTIFSYERMDRARNRANGAMMNGDTYSLRPVEG
ncbi:dyslexia-associated protein KIAA0319 isoform X2 [Pangasianodon hypophthalmus]|uniref:dyslexia-associated protein KIAA0319 isoform X2 n=1 Tax=Pangasianodon hypophthalmus TaxID=310915 RepID=UPI002307AF5D|nr:dyslexia-associated protein KIAA0319 isoform X2 [Pangasianodon hypophthalmus]